MADLLTIEELFDVITANQCDGYIEDSTLYFENPEGDLMKVGLGEAFKMNAETGEEELIGQVIFAQVIGGETATLCMSEQVAANTVYQFQHPNVNQVVVH